MIPGIYNFEDIYREETVPSRTMTIKSGGVVVPFPGGNVVGWIRSGGRTGAKVFELPIDDSAIGSGSFTIGNFDWIWPAGKYWYDIFIVRDGVRTPILAGEINVKQNVTWLT